MTELEILDKRETDADTLSTVSLEELRTGRRQVSSVSMTKTEEVELSKLPCWPKVLPA